MKSKKDKLREQLGLYAGCTEPEHTPNRDLLDKIIEEEIASKYSMLLIQVESAERDKERCRDLRMNYDELLETNAELKIKYLELLERVNRL